LIDNTLSVSYLGPFSMRPDRDLSHEWLAWLGHALGGASSDIGLPLADGLPPAGFEQVTPALFDHAVLPLVYLQMRDEPLWFNLPPAFRSLLTTAFQASATRAFLLEAELGRIVSALAQAKVPVGLLKGLALGRTVYPSIAVRPISDLDLLVPASAVDAARDVLVDLGYEGLSLPQRGRVGRWLRHYRAEIAMTDQAAICRGILAELHWSLAELPYYTQRINMADIWATFTPAPDLPHAMQPSPAVLMLHACAHLAFHHSRDLRLIWLVDVDRLARMPGFPWPEVVALAERWNLGLALQACLEAAIRWLNTPVPSYALARISALATDPVGHAMWGMGDERPGRAWQRARSTLAVLAPRDRLSYLSWLGLRLLFRPYEAATRPSAYHPARESRCHSAALQ
jgi:hypothetical protein